MKQWQWDDPIDIRTRRAVRPVQGWQGLYGPVTAKRHEPRSWAILARVSAICTDLLLGGLGTIIIVAIIVALGHLA